jgi:DNA-binding GntR family transcriptional regulator
MACVNTKQVIVEGERMERIQYYSLTDQVYDILKRRIIGREIQSNEKLDVNGLAVELGVSRMPVVEALTRLESDGLVERRNRVGTFVAPVNIQLFEEWLEMRAMIEDWAAPRVVAKATADDISRLKRLLKGGMRELEDANAMAFDFYKFIETHDTGFHIALIAIAGNSQIAEAFASIHTHARIGRSLIQQKDQLAACLRSQKWHERILDALVKRDSNALAREMHAHREDSASATISLLRKGTQA